MVFKNRVLRKTVETKGGGTNRRLKYYLDDEIKDVRWARHMEGMGRERVYSILFGKSEESYYLEDILVDGRLIWKWILSK